ncbi:MAG: hypothetical protein LUM44_20895 [Pyrinomonadaceae bacterium]|nr:hypothetical protein [Pyrinomonadaceae bacterium]
MQTELIEQIIHLPIPERIEIIERISRSLREDLRESDYGNDKLERRKTAYERLRGIASVKGKTPPTDEEVKEDYIDYISEKYK